MSFNGIEKSAVMLMSVGEELAAEIFKHLNSGEVQKLSVAISNLGHISNHQLTDILSEFEENATQYAAINVNTRDYLNSVLVKALGEEHANSLLEDIFETKKTVTGIDKLNFMAPEIAAEMIRDEHPQIIAATLVHLKRTQAAEILALLDEELRHDVVLRIATFGGIQPSALAELTEVLNSLLDEQNIKRSKMGGIRTAAEIINLMKSQQEEMVISAVKEYDDELAQKIIAEMFLFEDLIEMDDRSMQRLLQEVENDSLVIALKSCSHNLRDHFLNNMSQRAAKIMRDDLDSQLPVRLSQVETEQKAILSIVRRLSESGEIALNGGDDSYV